MLGRESLLAVGCRLITSYVSCTVLRALPAVTKADGLHGYLVGFISLIGLSRCVVLDMAHRTVSESNTIQAEDMARVTASGSTTTQAHNNWLVERNDSQGSDG